MGTRSQYTWVPVYMGTRSQYTWTIHYGLAAEVAQANKTMPTFPNVQPGSIRGFCAVDVGQSSQAETVPSRGIHIAINSDRGKGGGDLEDLSNLSVHLKVGYSTPEVRSCVCVCVCVCVCGEYG